MRVFLFEMGRDEAEIDFNISLPIRSECRWPRLTLFCIEGVVRANEIS